MLSLQASSCKFMEKVVSFLGEVEKPASCSEKPAWAEFNTADRPVGSGIQKQGTGRL